jgi:hypothetical protein
MQFICCFSATDLIHGEETPSASLEATAAIWLFAKTAHGAVY